MILWHGSSKIIKSPQYGFGNVHNDYGLGFYCTESEEMAKEWACADKENGFANCYDLDTAGLKICDLGKEPYGILNWMALLTANRLLGNTSSMGKAGAGFLTEKYLPDLTGFDVIIGKRADDSYFTFARAFLNNTISVRQLSEAMELGDMGEQVVIKSKKAFKSLKFLRYEEAYWSKSFYDRTRRDKKARLDYKALVGTADIDGVFIRDLMRDR